MASFGSVHGVPDIEHMSSRGTYAPVLELSPPLELPVSPAVVDDDDDEPAGSPEVEEEEPDAVVLPSDPICSGVPESSPHPPERVANARRATPAARLERVR